MRVWCGSSLKKGAPPLAVREEADAVVVDGDPGAVGAPALGAGDRADPQAVLVLAEPDCFHQAMWLSVVLLEQRGHHFHADHCR